MNLNNDAGTHMYELCVCALTPCKRKKSLDTLASKQAFLLLKTMFASNVAFSTFEAHFLQEHPKQLKLTNRERFAMESSQYKCKTLQLVITGASPLIVVAWLSLVVPIVPPVLVLLILVPTLVSVATLVIGCS